MQPQQHPPASHHNLAHSTSYSAHLTTHHTSNTTTNNHTTTQPAPPTAPATDPLTPRRLQRGDYHKGFLALLGQLTDVGDVDERAFGARFDELADLAETQQVWVVEDAGAGRVIATATLLVELKFIHGVSKIGHIEDVVVNGDYRGKNLGYKIISHLLAVARSAGCYKVILDCDDKNVAFYEKLGFKKHVNHMANYFDALGGGTTDALRRRSNG